ncbi:MAG TPA: tRNA pseudouridine(55) synthase TruB, partial [Thauera sp.]|nr:tRNA pseudouridine(55) synthase TruB [Thauera sp.]
MTSTPEAEVAATARPKRKGQPQRKIVRRTVDGVLLLDKPQGVSS